MKTVGVMLHPRSLYAHELEQIKENVKFERDVVYSNVKSLMLEKLQELAFRRGLGNSIICLEEYESKITAERLLDHFVRTMLHQGASAVAVGANQELFAQAISRATDGIHFVEFGEMPFIVPNFFGGETRYDAAGDLHHVMLGYPLEGGFQNPKAYITSRLLSNLYLPTTSVPYAENSSIIFDDGLLSHVHSFNGSTQLYSEGGLLAFHIETSEPTQIGEPLRHIKTSVKESISEDDFTRAKAAVIFDLRNSYDERNKYLEFTRDQISGTGRPWSLSELLESMKKITLQDVNLARETSFSVSPAAVFYGNIKELPYADQI